MINQNFTQNKNRYYLQGIKRIFLTVDSITTEIQGFRSATYECQTNEDGAYTFEHSLTINLPTNAYFILKDILDKYISFAFTTKNDDSFKLIEKCELTYSFVIGEQPQFQLTLQTPSNNPLLAFNKDDLQIDEILQLESCGYSSKKIDSLRIGATDAIDIDVADDEFTIFGTLYNIDVKNITFEENYEENIFTQSINFTLPFNNSSHSFSNDLIKFKSNTYTALMYFNNIFIIASTKKGLIPNYNISENTINVTLSNSYTQHDTIITSNITNTDSKDKYEIIDFKCYNGTNTATLLKKVTANEYVCFKPYLAEYQYNYNIIETFENIYTNKYGVKLYNDDVTCSAGDECLIIGLPSKVSFNYVDEVKEFDVTSFCSIAFNAENKAEVRLYDGKLTIRNKSNDNYNIICIDSNGYKRIIYVTVQNFTEIPSGYDIDAYGGTLNAVLSNDTSNIIETSSSLQYRLNGSGNGIIFDVPQNTTDDDIEYIARIFYNDNTCDVITITSKKGYTIKYYDGTVQCINGDKWMMYNTLMGQTEDKITDEVGYKQAYIVEKNSLECQTIKNVKTLGTVTLYSQKHNVNEYLLSTGEIIYKVINTNEYSQLDNTLNFWEELEDMYIYDGQDTVFQDVLFVVFDDNAYRTDYTVPSLRKANVDLSSIVEEKNTNSPLYKWADSGEIIEDNDTSVNCTKSVAVEYDPSNSDTWYCLEGVRYTISEEYIDLHCTGDWQFIGYSLAGTVGTFADQYTDCGLPEVGMFDVLVIYTDQRYKTDTYIDGAIIEGQYADNDDISSVIIGNGIVSIGEYAFYNCTNLSSVTFGESITSIGDSAFENCKLDLADFNEKLITIGNSAFYNNNLSNLTIPKSVTSIGDRCFARNIYLTNIFITSNAIIASNAFTDVATDGVYICKCATEQENALPDNWELDCN